MNRPMTRARRFLEIFYALAPRYKHTQDIQGSWETTTVWMRKLIAKTLAEMEKEEHPLAEFDWQSTNREQARIIKELELKLWKLGGGRQ